MIVTPTELLEGQGPLVVNVTVYVCRALALKFIYPVLVLTNTKPNGLALNVPVNPPVIVGVGFAPVWQYVPEE